jgi:hypothetical protein
LYFGVDNSSGNGFGSGGTAYAVGIYSVNNTPVNIGVNGATVTSTSSTGLAVTGTLSSTGSITQGGATANYAGNFRDASVGGSCYLQITTNASGSAGTDGFVWGLDTASPPNAYLSLKENANLYLQANSATVATVSSTGLAVTGTLTTTRSNAGDVATFTNGGASPTALYVNSTSGVSGIFNAASQGGGGIRFSSTASTISVAGSDVATVSSTGLAVTGTLSCTGNSGVGTSTHGTQNDRYLTIYGTTNPTLSLRNSFSGTGNNVGFDAFLDGNATPNVLLWQRANAAILFGTNGTQRAQIDSTGLAVTGTLSATDTVSANNNANTDFLGCRLINQNSGTSAQVGIALSTSAGTNRAAFQLTGGSYVSVITWDRQDCAYLQNEGAGGISFAARGASAPITFHTGGNSEKMRLDSSGNLLVGTTSSTAGYALKVGGANANILIQADSPNGATLLCDSSAAGSKPVAFGHVTSVAQAQVRCGGSGGVYLSDGATSWTAISDERQKTDLEPIVNAVEKVTMLRAVTGRYEWDEKRRSFLIAQDVQAVLPEAVDVADDENGTLGLAYTDVIPLLVAAIKELKMEFDAYKAAHP